MNYTIQKTLVIGSVLVAVAGCASNATKPGELQDVINHQERLQQDYQVANNAVVELDKLDRYVANANSAWQEGNDEEYEHQVYLAARQSEITESSGMAQHYRNEIDSMAEKRQQLLIEAKNMELEKTQTRLQQTESDLKSKQDELSTTQQELATKAEKVQELNESAQSAEQQVLSLASELSTVKAEMTQRGMVLTLQDILFEFDKAQLKPGAGRTIQKVAEFLDNNPKVEVTIEGFTDSLGSEQYNLKLSEQRAEAVKSALAGEGIVMERLQTKALGEQFPVASNDTEAGRQENRRVELVLNQES